MWVFVDIERGSRAVGRLGVVPGVVRGWGRKEVVVTTVDYGGSKGFGHVQQLVGMFVLCWYRM